MASIVSTGFRGAALRLVDGNMERAAERIGCRLVALQAVLAVETDGSGFDGQGRPAALFEPHLFYRYVPHSGLAEAIGRGLAYPSWRPGTYPRDSYPRIVAACAIDETAALRATSWGLGQQLGDECRACDLLTPQDLVLRMMASEGAQLDLLVRYLINSHIASLLAEERWAAFARAYNGPAYGVNHYDQKLAAYVAAHQSLSAKQRAAPPPANRPAVEIPPVSATAAPPPVPKQQAGVDAAAATALREAAAAGGGGPFVTLPDGSLALPGGDGGGGG